MGVKTKGQEIIEAKLAELEPGSKRYEVLKAAKRFKSSWIELGEKLTEVLEDRLYEDWGYSSFEHYCEEELRVRKGTAYKLTKSYSFLRDKEPQLLNTPEVGGVVPQLEVFDLLRQAQESPHIDNSTYKELRESAIAPDTTKAAFLREMRQADPETFKPAASSSPLQQVKKALSAAKRLHALLEEVEDVSGSAMEAVESIIVELEEKTVIRKAG